MLDENSYIGVISDREKVNELLLEAREKDREDLIGKSINIENEEYIVNNIDETDEKYDIAVLKNKENETITTEPVEYVKFISNEDNEKENAELKVNIKPKRRNKIEYFDLHPEIPLNDRNNYKIENNNLGIGTKKEKFNRNIEAIKILKKCDEENRYATPEEQEKLSEYVGWGGLAEAFDQNDNNWVNEYKELKSLLSEKEYDEARRSTLTSFYTPPIVISSIYNALEKMGLERGNILEPSCRCW